MRSSASIARASAADTGARRVAVSPRISTKIPPKPSMTSGPNCGSRTIPSNSSAVSPTAIGCTRTPSSRASGRVRAIRASIASVALAAASGESSPSTTPPTSVLCVMSGETILIATGAPSDRVTSAASAGERASRAGTTSMP